MSRLAIIIGICGTLALGAETPKPRPDPRARSIYPLTGRASTTWQATVRGTGLTGARAVVFQNSKISGRVLRVEAEPAAEGGTPPPSPVELVKLELAAAADVAGPQAFRLVTAGGVTNELSLRVNETEVLDESAASAPLSHFPAVVNGRIEKRGEVDSLWLDAKAGQTLTFTAVSGNGAFDPSLTVVEQSGSWFDARRINRIAFNDEPLYFPGLSTDARLVHRFQRAGRYAIQIQAFSGLGGADYAYQLRVDAEAARKPSLHPLLAPPWDERMFTRHISADWLVQLARRGGYERDERPVAVVQASTDPLNTPPITIPALVEGRIQQPAEAHRIRVHVEKPQDLAIEIETPDATMPRFNPVVRLMAPDGSEVVTNVYTKRNNNGLYMMKMIQAKSTFALRSSGEYLLEIRDITTDVAGADFAYRVLVRPQIPHVGKIEVVEDRINMEPGEAKALTVNLDREENFSGLVAVSAKGLPPGVTAVTGMANPVEKPPLPNGGRLERYVGKPQTASVMLIAAPGAPLTETPVAIRILTHTVNNSRPGTPIVVKEIPLMVIARRPS